MNVYDFALDLFRSHIVKNRDKLKKLHSSLVTSRMDVSSEKYYALILLSVLISFIVSMILTFFIVVLSGITLVKIVFALIFPFAVSAGVGLFIYFYPRLKAGQRKKKIENALSFATIYMTTMAESSILPKDMFRLMGQLEEYGEIAEESKRIAEDVEVLGLDLPTAIDRAISRSPSFEWSEFLSGFKTTITGGGDLSSYLKEKSKGYTSEYKKKLVQFGKMLGLLIQMYLTVVGVGTVFFIVISSLMGVMGGVSTLTIKAMQYMVVLVGIPMVTLMMIIIIRAISPINIK